MTVASHPLRSLNTKSCGCLKREQSRKNFVTHGFCRGGKSPEYHAWIAAKRRCYNTQDKSYVHYGGRGITMCDRWKDNFPAFFKDMGPRPSNGHSLGRIDNDGPYSPENCRWETVVEQSRNTRNCRPLTHMGRRLLLRDWAEQTSLPEGTIHDRLRRGWSVANTLSTPANYTRHKYLTHNGVTKSIAAWSKETGIRTVTLHCRVRTLGWTVERALTAPVRRMNQKTHV